MTIDIVRPRMEDLEAVHELLLGNGLPIDGLADHLAHAYVARHDGRIVGVAALEAYADGGSLRSVAVSPDFRGTGVGRRLVERVIDLARSKQLSVIYLLTTTAAGYFPKLGFVTVSREQVPPGVRQSIEFTTGCCASAVVMTKQLQS
jgi:amino-acid N-acetyltransferase